MRSVPEGERLLSPCVGTCRLDEASGWCVGCGRTGDELAGWSTLPQPARDEVWARLPERLASLGVDCHLLPWSPDALADRLEPVLATVPGRWWTDAHALDGPGVVEREHRRFELATATGRLRLHVPPGTRGFVVTGAQGPHLVLSLHRSRPLDAASISAIRDGWASSPPELDALPLDYRTLMGFTPTRVGRAALSGLLMR